MNKSDVSNMLSYRLRKLAKSGVPAHELADSLRELMEVDRAEKYPAGESQQESTLPFVRRQQVHLSVV